MFRYILIAGLCLSQAAAAQNYSPVPATPLQLFSIVKPAQGFDCANRSCKALSSCEEACHKLLVCGQAIRDGDSDGILCENLCSRRC